MYLKMSQYRNLFYDRFGNRFSVPIVEKYEKNSDGEWILDKSFTSNSNCYIIDGQIYYFDVGGDTLMSLNMDFDSPNCYACYKLVGERTDYERIVGNTVLYQCEVMRKYLHRQDYSDGTCFYSIHSIGDGLMNFRVNEGSSDLNDLVRVLNQYNKIDQKYKGIIPNIDVTIDARNKMIEYMLDCLNKSEVKNG